MARNRDTGEQESSTFTSTSFVLSVLFLAGVLATGIILVATGPHRDPAAAAVATAAAEPATSNAAPPAPRTATPATGSGAVGPPATPTGPQVAPAPLRPSSSCGLPAGVQQIPTAAPAGSWQIVAGIAVPSSPVFGPARLVGGIGTCYARSPTGALFAMMDTLALTEAPSDQISATAVVTRRGSHTGQYAQALTAAKTQDSGGGVGSRMPSDASTTPKVTLLGFRFVDYTPDRTTIAVAVGVGDPARSGSYQPAMLTAVLAWEGGDWKFVYSDQTGATAAPIISTEQYTAWAA